MSQQTISDAAIHTCAETGSAPWARGDFAVHPLAMAVPLIDGRAAMLAACVAFMEARSSIWVANWSIFARLQLVRGQDQRAGPDGSAEQYALLDRLRAAGLDSAAIALWRSGGLSLVDVLRLVARRGVDVRVLLWDPLDPWDLGHWGNDPAEQAAILSAQGIRSRLDKNCRSPLHIAQGLHQKCAVVDSQVAFVGGIDFTVEYSGDFDRWDLSSHPFWSQLRETERGISSHPWHDAEVMLTGPAVLDVERNIHERWDASAGRVQQRVKPLRENIRGIRGAVRSGGRPHLLHAVPSVRSVAPDQATLPATQSPAQPPREESARGHAQIIRTIPALTYRFALDGIYGIAQWYQQAVRRAERFIYLESQYLWVEGLPKLNFTRLGWQSRKMRALVEDLAEAAERGVSIALVLPDHPNVGRAVTDETIEWLRDHAPRAVAANRLHFYTLAACSPGKGDTMRYRPVYVHAKVAVIDDRWATVGSANLNSRGMSHDAELNIAIEERAFARGLRQILWAEHTGMPLPDDFTWPVGDTSPSPEAPGGDLAMRVQALVHALAEPRAARRLSASTAEPIALAARLADPEAGMGELARLADENLQRLHQGEPLSGYLLPYLRASEGPEHDLRVERYRGLLDPLREVREGVVVPHYNRYV
ncbi:MAG: phospholipase D-like domain-containing protein [Nitrososphaerota archaeon]